MKKIFSCLLSFYLAAPLFALTLVENGKSAYRIVIAESATPAIRQSATEFQTYLKKAAGVLLPIVSGESGGQNEIHIFTESATSETKQLSPESWNIHVGNGAIRLSGGSDRGTFYAVCEFLERYVGVRWLGINLESVPRVKSLSLPDQVFHSGTPAFPEQRCYYFFQTDKTLRNSDYRFFSIHNKANLYNLPEYGYGKRTGSPRAGSLSDLKASSARKIIKA